MDDNQALSPKTKIIIKWVGLSIGAVVGAYFSFNFVTQLFG